MPRPAAVAVLLVAAAAALAADGVLAANATSPGFLECLSKARGRGSRSAVLNANEEQRDEILGKVMGCAKAPVMRGLRAVRDSARGGNSDVQLMDGAVVLHRLQGAADADPGRHSDREAEASRALGDDDDLVGVHDVIVELDRVSRSYAMDVEVYPGVTASLHRDAKSEDAVNLSFKLDTKGLLAQDGDVEGRDGRDADEDEDEEETNEDGAGAAEDRHGHKKKKVLKGLKKLKKKLAPYLPLLAIPLAIQLMMLPLYIMALKMMALKSILLGKMTLMLVAFNILRNVQQRQHEDDHNSRVAAEYYGYHDDGIEYGGWVNRRRSLGDGGQGRSQRGSRRRR